MQKEKEMRCWRYSPDCPEGKIFTGAEAIAAAEKDGWVDSPAKLKRRSRGGGGKDKAARESE